VANTDDIYARRAQILANHSKVAANQSLVANYISKQQ
jgi:hypothetical protein